MRNTFTGMQPNLENLVKEKAHPTMGPPTKYHSVLCLDILCVECGYEAHAANNIEAVGLFQQHTCRLVSSMVSEQN